jgi:hypothetical protein
MAEHVDATNELTKPPADAAATAEEVSSASTASDDPGCGLAHLGRRPDMTPR